MCIHTYVYKLIHTYVPVCTVIVRCVSCVAGLRNLDQYESNRSRFRKNTDGVSFHNNTFFFVTTTAPAS